MNLKMLILHEDLNLDEMIDVARFLGQESIQIGVLHLSNGPQIKPERFHLEDLKRIEILLESLHKNTTVYAFHINEFISLEGYSECVEV